MRIFRFVCAVFALLWGEALAKCPNPYAFALTVGQIEGPTVPASGIAPAFMGSGTVWYPDAWHAVTNAHVVKGLGLSTSWKSVTIKHWSPFFGGEAWFERRVRVVAFAGIPVRTDAEMPGAYLPLYDEAVLRLETPVPFSQRLRIREGPVKAGEEVISFGYPDGFWQWAKGHVHQECFGAHNCNAEGMRVHLESDTNVHVMSRGSSGAPIVSCEDGAVVGTLWSIPLRAEGSSLLTNRVVHASPLRQILSILFNQK